MSSWSHRDPLRTLLERTGRPSWTLPERILGSTWAQLKSTWSQLGSKLGPSWSQVERSWGKLRPSWGYLRQHGANLKQLGTRASWAQLGLKFAQVSQPEPTWSQRRSPKSIKRTKKAQDANGAIKPIRFLNILKVQGGPK